MTINEFEIVKYSEDDRKQILDVWEASVLATLDFLNPTDFKEIKTIVHTIDFNAFDVYCLKKDFLVAGFIGVLENKIEMLFVLPECTGKGFGKKLTNFALTRLHADKVDVNEQNIEAIRFYEKFGFRTYDRTDKDDQGKNYPLLRMKLDKQ